ncbi:hypothetical protein KAR91_47895 [Candidatus Pacearchaeota archaeon]|nr:hypothetical protein [Candidatus Pacearchaeota archaeon]
MREEEKEKLIKDMYRATNERARYKHALELVLQGMGIGDYFVNMIVKHAKMADFVPLKSAIVKSKQ